MIEIRDIIQLIMLAVDIISLILQALTKNNRPK